MFANSDSHGGNAGVGPVLYRNLMGATGQERFAVVNIPFFDGLNNNNFPQARRVGRHKWRWPA